MHYSQIYNVHADVGVYATFRKACSGRRADCGSQVGCWSACRVQASSAGQKQARELRQYVALAEQRTPPRTATSWSNKLGLAGLEPSEFFYISQHPHPSCPFLDPTSSLITSIRAYACVSLPPGHRVVKPLYGFISDSIPLFGYRRRSYLALCGFLGGCGCGWWCVRGEGWFALRRFSVGRVWLGSKLLGETTDG